MYLSLSLPLSLSLSLSFCWSGQVFSSFWANLKSHKCLGSLYLFQNQKWVTDWVSQWQCHVLSCPQTVPGQLKASHFKCMFIGSSVRPARTRYCLTLTRWRGMDGGKRSKVLPSTRQRSVLVRGVQKYWTSGPSLQFVCHACLNHLTILLGVV